MSNFIDEAIAKAKKGDCSELESKDFPLALKKIRADNELIYDYDYKPELKKLLMGNPELLRAIDKHSKPPSKRRSRQAAKESEGDSKEVSKRGESISSVIIDLVESKAELFCNKAGMAFITFTYDLPTNIKTGEVLRGYIQTVELMASKEQLSYLLYDSSGVAPSDGALNDALRVLVQKARAYPTQEVYRRYGEVAGNSEIIYIDLELVNEPQKVVEVSGGGWCVISMSDCPVKFLSGHGSYPLPMPARGGDISLLWDYVNVTDEESRLLVVAWLLECMRINTEYPLLEIASGAGYGKTSAQERLKKLIDPASNDLVAPPNTLRDMQTTVINSHLVSLDNITKKLTTEELDLFCLCSTGGSIELRALYTTNKVERYSVARPVILNGIYDLIDRNDVAQRTITLELTKLDRNTNRSKFKPRWQRDYPVILGALYDLLAGVLRDLPSVVDDGRNPRLGDFADLGKALCFGLGSSASFVDIYTANFERVISRGLEANPAALALIKLMSDTGLFEGTASELLHQINSETCKPLHFDRKNWPNDAQALARKIREAEPTLKLRGVSVIRSKGRSNKTMYEIVDANYVPKKHNGYAAARSGLL